MKVEKSWFLLTYTGSPNYVEKRTPFRKSHIELVTEFTKQGDLILGGAYAEPVDGSVLVFYTSGVDVVEGFVKRDPYAQNSEIVTAWKIRKLNIVTGTACPNPLLPEML